MDFETTAFIFALLVNFAAAAYAFYIRSLMRGGALQTVALAGALSSLVFGFHHLGELFLEGTALLPAAESIESISGALLIWAIYQLRQMTMV